MPFKRLHSSCHVACQPGAFQDDNAGAASGRRGRLWSREETVGKGR